MCGVTELKLECCRAANVQHPETQLAENQAGLGNYAIQWFPYSQRNVLVGSRTHTLHDMWRPDTGIRGGQRQVTSLVTPPHTSCLQCLKPESLHHDLTSRSLVVFKPCYPASSNFLQETCSINLYMEAG